MHAASCATFFNFFVKCRAVGGPTVFGGVGGIYKKKMQKNAKNIRKKTKKNKNKKKCFLKLSFRAGTGT